MGRKADLSATLGQALTERLGAERYGTWFRQVQFQLRERTVTAQVPSTFLHDWIRKHFWRDLRESVHATFGEDHAVELEVVSAGARGKAPLDPSQKTFVFEAEVADGGAAARDALSSSPAAAPPSVVPEPAGAVPRPVAAAHPSGNGKPSTESGMNGAPHDAVATPLPRKRNWGTFDTFQVGGGNRLACTAARMVVESPGKINPVVLYGPSGAGKSHLLQAIWSQCKRNAPKMHVVCQTAEQFTTDFVAAVKAGLPSFRRKYRSVDVFLVDDVHFFRGKKATLGEFVHTLSTLRNEGKQVVLTSDRPPQELQDLGSDFASRVAGGLACPLELPDLATRTAIVRQVAAAQGCGLPGEVVDWIAARLTGSARELAGAVHRLQVFAAAHDQSIDLALAERALLDLVGGASRVVQLSDVEQAVCAVCGVQVEEMHSGRRSKSIANPRMLAMWLARRFTRAPYSEIGRYFGRRSHSTVISAQKQVDLWVSGQRSVEVGAKNLPVEEVVRLVEQRLRVAG